VLVWLVGYPILITFLEALGARSGWTLEYLAEFARRPDEWRALFNSLWISAASVALAAAVGVPMAFVFERTDSPTSPAGGSWARWWRCPWRCRRWSA
jgi:iron(III) transport system permease protein